MLPMPLLHPWNLVVSTYTVGLLCSVAKLAASNESDGPGRDADKIILLLCFLGVGLFSYYQGRSHDLCLITVWWPAFAVLSILLGKSVSLLVENRPSLRKKGAGENGAPVFFPAFLALLLTCVLSFGLLSIADNAPALLSRVESATDEKNDIPAPLERRNVLAVKQNTRPGGEVLIISEAACLYHLLSRTASPLETPGMTEIQLRSDFEKLLDYIARGNWSVIFLDSRRFPYHFPRKAVDDALERAAPIDIKELEKGFILISAAPLTIESPPR